MALARLKISRLLGGFWWSRRDGWYGRFVESGVYPIAVEFLGAGGFACVLVVLGYAAFDRSAGALVASVIAVGLYGLALAFLTSFGVSVTQSARHAGSPAELLARCRKLLEQHDFVLGGETADSIEAARGASAGAESNWRGCPLEIGVKVSSAGDRTEVSVRCTGESGRHRFARRLILKTAEAAANLDQSALNALDKTLVRRPGALFQGGLGTMVLGAMLACALFSSAALIAASYRLALYVLETTQASAAADEIRRLQVQLTAGIDAALQAEAGRLAGKLDKDGSKGTAPAEAMRSLAPFSAPGELLAGVAESQGKLAILSPASVPWTQETLKGARMYGLARLGDTVVRELPQPQARDLEARLGLKPGQLIIGSSLTHADLARFAPDRIDSGSLEITFFDSSRPFLRYAWRPGKGVRVDAGSGALPADVLAGAERRLDSDWTMILRDVLIGGDVGGTAIRKENRDGAPHRVYYRVTRKDGRTGGWDGVSVARSYEPAFDTQMREWILPLAVALALIALLPVLIATVVLASVISNRISRPALQVRDALRSIGEGDYSVRLAAARRDEIGQVQAQLNKTAEELEKREQSRQ
jgi:HAMP domain-containing protein